MELTPKQIKAATMLANGHSCAKTARDVNTAETTLRRWRKLPEFAELIKEKLDEQLGEAACEAMQVLKTQLHDENKFLAQNAARDLLTRYDTARKLYGSGKIEVVVTGMPELGMPRQEAESYEIPGR